jgi:hypothetical protein
MRGELPPVAARSYARTSVRASAVEQVLSRIVAVLSDRDSQAVVGFCTIGLLLTVNVILRFPDFGLQVATLAAFP